MLPSASHRGLPVISARLMPMSANTRPTSAPVSSSSTTGSSGLLVVRMNRHHDRPSRLGVASRRAVRNDQASSTIATPSTPNAQIGDSSSCGSMSFSMPSNSANIEPRVKSTSATTNAQK